MKRAMPMRFAKVELEGDFTGWSAIVRANPMLNTMARLASKKIEQIQDALPTMIVVWNFGDEAGEALGTLLSTEEGMSSLTKKHGKEALGKIAKALNVEESEVDLDEWCVPDYEKSGMLTMDLLAQVADKYNEVVEEPPLRKKSK